MTTYSDEAENAAQEYKATLDELVNNNKTQINLLTILAEDYKQHAHAIVQQIERQILIVDRKQKLPVMYVIDSIIKNVQPSEYKELFEKVILKLFLHVFKEGDESVRSSLYKLRCTWPGIFMPSVLYKLDIKVNGEDSNWPIVNPKTQARANASSSSAVAPARTVVINPPPAQDSPSMTSSVSADTIPTTRVHVNPKFFNQTAQGKSSSNGKTGKTTTAPSGHAIPATTSASISSTKIAGGAVGTAANPRDPRQNRTGGGASGKGPDGKKAIKRTSESQADADDGKNQGLIDDLLTRPHPLEKRESTPEPPPKLSRFEGSSSDSRARANDSPPKPPTKAQPTMLKKGAVASTSTNSGSGKRRSNESLGKEKKHSKKDIDMRQDSKSPVTVVHKTAELGSHAFVTSSSKSNTSSASSGSSLPLPNKSGLNAKPLLANKKLPPQRAMKSPTMSPDVLRNMILPPITAVTTQHQRENLPSTNTPPPAHMAISTSHLPSSVHTNLAQTSITTSVPPSSLQSSASMPQFSAPMSIQQSTMFVPSTTLSHQSVPSSLAVGGAPLLAPAFLPPATGMFLPGLAPPTANPLFNMGLGSVNPLLLPPSAAFLPGMGGVGVNVNVSSAAGLILQNSGQLRPPPIITHETMKFEGIPANNRIFVDGKAHEVLYVDETAVIERNGLPHRIYFAGPPRDILIDGQRVTLAFGETKTVFIDGQPHQMRFGAPSRELYMGDYPFKGQFGGPPIIAHINNIRHEIRLTGAAPEVKIEPEPAYDLACFLNRMREERTQPQQKEEKPKPPKQDDLTQLLLRLKNSGALKPVESRSDAPVAHSEGKRLGLFQADAKSHSPAAASYHADLNLDALERKREPNVSFKDFNARNMVNHLKIYYDTVIDDLLKKRHDVCMYCGLRMEPKGEKWNRHMDWHVQQNLNKVADTSKQRRWFKTVEELFKELEAGNKTVEEAGKIDKKKSRPSTIGSNLADNKECAVCGERFDEYFDEDHDEWRFRNATVIGNVAYHRGCAADATLPLQNGDDGATDGNDNGEDVKPDAYEMLGRAQTQPLEGTNENIESQIKHE